MMLRYGALANLLNSIESLDTMARLHSPVSRYAFIRLDDGVELLF